MQRPWGEAWGRRHITTRSCPGDVPTGLGPGRSKSQAHVPQVRLRLLEGCPDLPQATPGCSLTKWPKLLEQ